MSIYNEVCHCSHDRSSHHEGQYTCLGMRCDCEKYTHRDDPLPKKPAVRPKHASWCQCLACKAAAPVAPAPDSDQVVTPRIHPAWCVCTDCMSFYIGRP